MAQVTLVPDGIVSTGTWTGFTVLNLSSSENTRAVSPQDGGTFTPGVVALQAAPAMSAFNSAVFRIEASASTTTGRTKAILVELLNAANSVIASFTTPTLTTTDTTYSSSVVNGNFTKADIDGWQIRVTAQEGSGMPGSVTARIDRIWLDLDYTAPDPNVTVTALSANLAMAGSTPSLMVSAHLSVTANSANLALTGQQPTFSVGAPAAESLTVDTTTLTADSTLLTADATVWPEEGQSEEVMATATTEELLAASGSDPTLFPAGHNYSHSSDLDLGYDLSHSVHQIIGLRFETSIRSGDTINSAKVTFDATGTTTTGTVALLIQAHKAVNPSAFVEDPDTVGSGDLSNRPRTTASVSWSITEGWDFEQFYDSPDLTSVLQEVVNMPGFSGDVVLLFIADDLGSTANRRADNNAASWPVLSLNYTPEPPSITLASFAG